MNTCRVYNDFRKQQWFVDVRGVPVQFDGPPFDGMQLVINGEKLRIRREPRFDYWTASLA